MFSLLQLTTSTRPAPDVQIFLPYLTEDLARNLLGADDSHYDNQLPNGQIHSFDTWVSNEKSLEDATQLTFSDNYESKLDLKTLLRELKTGHIQPNPDARESYLVAEQVSARTVSLLLPLGTPAEVARSLVANAPSCCNFSLRMVDGRWQLTSRLAVPRPISAAFLALQSHHSKPHFVAMPETSAHLAIRLGWIESLPAPTDFWLSSPPGPAMTVSQSQTLLHNALNSGGLYPGIEFLMPRGYAVLTPKELLQGENSTQPDSAHRFKIDSHSIWRIFCRAWNCSTGTVREMVLVVGAEPPYRGRSQDVPTVVPLNDQIQTDLVRSLKSIEANKEVGSTCYALLYVYDRHWDGIFDLYSLAAHGMRAQEHLRDSKLNGVLECKL